MARHTKRPRKAQACDGKKAYGTKSEAMDSLMQFRRSGARNMQVYRCRFCNKFHMGH